MKKFAWFFCLGTLLLNPGPLFAQAGDLDDSFGTNGITSTDLGTPYDFGYALALQSDGKILVAGRSSFGLPSSNNPDRKVNRSGFNSGFDIVRYATDGARDHGFGSNGIVSVDMGTVSGASEAHAIAVQPDRKILVAGYLWTGTEGDFVVVRLDPDGTLDSSFAQSGIFTIPFASGGAIINVANAVLIQKDKKIILAGRGYNGTNYVFALVRLLSDGSLDTSFGEGGSILTYLGGVSNYGNSAVLQKDEKILLAGLIAYNSDANDFAMVRYLPDGELDESFGNNGFVRTTFGKINVDSAQSVVIQPDAKIVVAGYANFQFAMARYLSDGSLDPSFGAGGKVSTALGRIGDFCYGAVIQPDGKIILAGSTSQVVGENQETFFALVRYLSDGSIDSTFGIGGVVLTSFYGLADYGHAIALQRDGKIVVAGSVSKANNFNLLFYDYGVARYLNDLNPDN